MYDVDINTDHCSITILKSISINSISKNVEGCRSGNKNQVATKMLLHRGSGCGSAQDYSN